MYFADWTRRLDSCTELNSFLTVIQALSSSCTTGNTIIKLKLLKLLFLQSYRVRKCTNLIECLQNMYTSSGGGYCSCVGLIPLLLYCLVLVDRLL